MTRRSGVRVDLEVGVRNLDLGVTRHLRMHLQVALGSSIARVLVLHRSHNHVLNVVVNGKVDGGLLNLLLVLRVGIVRLSRMHLLNLVQLVVRGLSTVMVVLSVLLAHLFGVSSVLARPEATSRVSVGMLLVVVL